MALALKRPNSTLFRFLFNGIYSFRVYEFDLSHTVYYSKLFLMVLKGQIRPYSGLYLMESIHYEFINLTLVIRFYYWKLFLMALNGQLRPYSYFYLMASIQFDFIPILRNRTQSCQSKRNPQTWPENPDLVPVQSQPYTNRNHH